MSYPNKFLPLWKTMYIMEKYDIKQMLNGGGVNSMYLGNNLIWPTRSGFCIETVQLPIRNNCNHINVIGENLTIENHLGLDWYIIDFMKEGRIIAKDPSFDIYNELCNGATDYYIEFDFILLDYVYTNYSPYVFQFGSNFINNIYNSYIKYGFYDSNIVAFVGFTSSGDIYMNKNELMTFRLIVKKIDSSQSRFTFKRVQDNNQINTTIPSSTICNTLMHGDYFVIGKHFHESDIGNEQGTYKFGIRNIHVGTEFASTV